MDRGKVDEKISIKKMIPLGLQHVLVMYAGAIAVPLVVGNSIGLSSAEIAIIIAADLFVCGIATFIQSFGLTKYVGICLPVTLGVAFTGVGPLIGIAKKGGIQTMLGSVIAAGIFILLIAPLFSRLIKLFPKVLIGSIPIVVGITLIPVGFNNIVNGHEGGAEPTSIFLAVIVISVVIIFNKYFKGFLQALSILFAIIIGTIVATFMGLVDFTPVANAGLFSIVQPFYFGLPKFEFTSIITMVIVAIVIMIESSGIFIAISEICFTEISMKDIIKGLRAEGIVTILGGIFNAFPYTTFAQNMGLLTMTKVVSRFVISAAGVIFVILGLLPKFAALATIIPKPVFGAAMILMFSMVVVSGIGMLKSVDLNDNKNALILAVAVGLGSGASIVPGFFDQFPDLFVQVFGHSGIVVGAISGMLMNIILNFKTLFGRNRNKEQLTKEV